MLRMREGLRKRLEGRAKKNGNSLNAEMVGRLEVSFLRDDMEARDTVLVELLTGNRAASGELLRAIVAEVQRRPFWDQSQSGIDDMAKRLDYYVRNPGFISFDEDAWERAMDRADSHARNFDANKVAKDEGDKQ